MKVHLGYFLAFAALALAISAAFFSVYGLSHMFAGAALSVIIMASTLEVSKLIIASYLHEYWNKMNKMIRGYLTAGVVILALITSLGIYGYLSNAYQITANKLEMFDSDISVVESKIQQYETKIESNNKIIDNKTKRIDQLMSIRAQQEDRITTANNRNNRSAATSTNNDINTLNKEIDALNTNNTSVNDSISKLKTIILEKKSANGIAAEVGTLQYLSDITGMEMSRIVNIFILLIVFVFDPLAICLVIATNSVFDDKKKQKLESKSEEIIDELEQSPKVVDFDDTNELLDKMVEVIENKSDLESDESLPPTFPIIKNVSDKTLGEELIEAPKTNEEVQQETKSLANDLVPIQPMSMPKIEDVIPQEVKVEPKIVQQESKTEPERIRYDQIKEVKQRKAATTDRGFSKPIPNRQNGTKIERY